MAKKRATAHKAGAGRSPDDTISDDQIKDALGRSGYLVEFRAAQEFEDRGWTAVPNYAFPHEGTTRELDVLATYETKLDKGLGQIRAVVLAECINNPQPLAVFSRPEEYGGATK